MEYVTSKTPLPSKAVELVNKTTGPFEEFVKDFIKDFDRNPEKLRALLNLLFIPRFKPTFNPTLIPQTDSPHDLALVSTPAAKPSRYPMRMFDLATGNLVENPSIGVTGQYCIVSHSWKGSEIEYSFITDMKSSDMRKVKELAVEERMAAAEYSEDQRSDVQKIKDKCRVEIDEQVKFIKFLAANASGKMSKSNASGDIVRGLLASRVDVKLVEDEYEYAVREDQDAKAKRYVNKMNANDFKSLARGMEGKVLSAKGQDNQATDAESKDDEEQSPEMDRVGKAQRAREAWQNDIKFFQENSRLRAAVDEMVSCLQRWRSAIKIEQSIECAKKVFDEKFFPNSERRYLWLDSCCIDKRNHSEKVESFSLMGDWYAHAEFCLVHLDERDKPEFCKLHNDSRCSEESCDNYKRRRNMAEEWIHEWDMLKKDRPREPNFTSFGDICKDKPQWATRGWTLQELILSKNTFYVHSAWGALSRPVENLGPYYYICPFIALYCCADERGLQEVEKLQGFWKLDVLKDIMKLGNVNLRDRNENSLFTSNEAHEDATRIQVAQKLIIILEDLGVQIPKDIDRETATSRIAKAVYFATEDLSEEKDTGNRVNKTLFDIFKGYLRENAPEYFPNGGTAKEVIDFLLKCLAAEARDPVLRDREYVANFSNVENLSGWKEGIVRTKFPAEMVMSLARKREVTVESDAAYSLMGLFAVRFPAFEAEGLPKALSRLVDEIVISSNDISVFNWSGIEWASPIRGRSLHPSSLKAFKLPDNANKELAKLVQTRMREVMAAYENTFTMLLEAISFVKKKEQRNLPIEWIQGVIRFVKKAQFAALQQQQKSVGKILKYIQKNCGDVPVPPKSQDKKPEKSGTGSGKSGPLSLGTRPPLSIIPSLPKAKMSLPKFPGKSSESEASSEKGTGFSRPSFGKFGKKDSGSSKSPPAETEAPTPLSPTMSTAKTIVEEPQDPSPPEPQPAKAIWKPLHPRVMGFIKSITPQDAYDSDDEDDEDVKSPETPAAAASPTESTATLPPEVQEVVVDISETRYAKKATGTDGMGSTISPNPIIVNNSGIEGIFDIQRVIITMREPEMLRADIRKAASPYQKITGRCTISTGFAMVVVNFRCEKHLLEKQLDVVEAVESKVVTMQRGNPEEEVDAELWKGITAAPLTPPLGDKKESVETSKEEQEAKDGPEDVDDKHQTEEEKMVSRMIKFIEEPYLEAVAGEWVLVRFSNTPGAKWFLCHFELGPTHEFYGYRIAADEINFHDASPEPGLLNVWNTYMARKKRKLCKILQTYIDTKDLADSSVEVRKEGMKAGTEMLKGGTNLAKRALSSLSDDPGRGSEGMDFEGVMDQILEHGKTAAKRVGHFTVLALGEKLLEMHAERLEKNLSASVLKRTPKRLRGAVESLNDNKDLLPAMFHSSRRIHMF